MKPPAGSVGPLPAARIAAGLIALAMAVTVAGCWPFPSSTPSPSPSAQVSKPAGGPQTADANDAVAERFPPLDPNGRIEEESPDEAARRDQGLDLLRAVRPNQMPSADAPWPTSEAPTATIPPQPKTSPEAPQRDETAGTTNPAEDQTPSTMKSPSVDPRPPAGELGRPPDVEQAQRPKRDESGSRKGEESRPPRAARESRPQKAEERQLPKAERESRTPKTEESQPSTPRESPAPKARERPRSKIAHRGRREPREYERPTMQASKQAETPHVNRSIRDARASMARNSVPTEGQLALPAALRPTRPPL